MFETLFVFLSSCATNLNYNYFSDSFKHLIMSRDMSDMAASRRRLGCLRSGLWSLLFYYVYSHLKLVLAEEVDSCDNLKLGQYPLIIVLWRNSHLNEDNLPEAGR